jgi:hypothetical protein
MYVLVEYTTIRSRPRCGPANPRLFASSADDGVAWVLSALTQACGGGGILGTCQIPGESRADFSAAAVWAVWIEEGYMWTN